MLLGVFLVVTTFILMVFIHTAQKEKQSDVNPAGGFRSHTVLAVSEDNPLIVGSVIVQDLEGKRISGFSSAVFDKQWFAAPVWSYLEGSRLIFQSADLEESPIKKGLWTTGDPIVLWKLEGDVKGEIIQIMRWKQSIPLQWRSILNRDSILNVDPGSPERRGSFLIFPLPYELQESGVFIQEGHIVGWSFPEWMDKGYLWLGPEGKNMSPNIQMERFSDSIRSAWRETHFNNVLIREEGIPALRKLEIFANGLLMDSPFSEEDIPKQLRSQSVIDRMHSLASELIKNGFAEEVVRIIDEHIIIEAQDANLLKDAVIAKVESEGYHKAIRFLESVKRNVFAAQGQGIPGTNQFHAKLYKDWLRKILDQGGYYSGMVAFDEAKQAFPDDLELHLLGVEVAISEKNWKRATELLQMRDYPEAFRDWVNELKTVIQEIQENEGSVLIRFNPTSGHIPVQIILNRFHAFPFIIDTGATMCSIPSSAVKKLGIEIDQTTPVVIISTAGGIAETYEVKLQSVELGGFRIFDVKALIIDIPGYTGYGLLGQNFLNNFHIEIDNKKGMLRLKKR